MADYIAQYTIQGWVEETQCENKMIIYIRDHTFSAHDDKEALHKAEQYLAHKLKYYFGSNDTSEKNTCTLDKLVRMTEIPLTRR